MGKSFVKSLILILLVLAHFQAAFAQSCKAVFEAKSLFSARTATGLALSTSAALRNLEQGLPRDWQIPAQGSPGYNHFLNLLSPALKREVTDIGSWNSLRTSAPRVAVPVARLSQNEINSFSHPRLHNALPSLAKDGQLHFPEHVKLEGGLPQASETFHVRMMVIKESGSDSFEIPPQLEYLRSFIEKSFLLEKQRNPESFNQRLAYIQVDASWVEAGQLQARPGKLTTQTTAQEFRQGAHVDGFLIEPFYKLEEDITYSISTGFDQTTGTRDADNIPTEFFDAPFVVPSGLNHKEARLIYDQVANQVEAITLPSGFINRMSSRVVHRVGVAQKTTYRTFAKIKFSDEIFNQVGNTINGTFKENLHGKIEFIPSAIYQRWQSAGVPIVERSTLPTEGLIDPKDTESFKNRSRLGSAE